MSDPAASLAPGLYPHPFSRAYWRDAAKELKSTRMLCLAALMTALRVALKSLAIPIAPPTLYLYPSAFINALGASLYGPVVALLAAAVSDTLGALLFPTGVYFFPFIFTEMAGSLIFALFFYRAPKSPVRILLARFSVSFWVNIVLQSPIMLWYYRVILGKSYALFDLPRICKNLVLFPLESLFLMFLFGLLDPITYRLRFSYDPPKPLRPTRRALALLLALFLAGSAATAGYYVYDFNTRNHTNDFTGSAREDFNRSLYSALLSEDAYADACGDLVLVNTIYTRVGSETRTVTFTAYTLAEGESALPEDAWGLLNSAAARRAELQPLGKYTVTMEKNSPALLSSPAPAA